MHGTMNVKRDIIALVTIQFIYVKFLFFISSVSEDCQQLFALLYDFSAQSLPDNRHIM